MALSLFYYFMATVKDNQLFLNSGNQSISNSQIFAKCQIVLFLMKQYFECVRVKCLKQFACQGPML